MGHEEFKNSFELMIKLEGWADIAYDCPAGYRTVGVGFNMQSSGARQIWKEVGVKEDFDKVYNKEEKLSKDSAMQLFVFFWMHCEDKAQQRAEDLGIVFTILPFWHRFILMDIVYNTGSVSNWSKVFKETEPEKVLFEARRNPKEMMDSRVAKIGKYFNLLNSIEEAKEIGLVHTKYIV